MTSRKKFWNPISKIVNIFDNYCRTNSFTKILELGPGNIPFPSATHFVDNKKYQTDHSITFEIDLDNTDIPREQGEFDFGYARHVFEDLQNPDFCFKNFTRVCKRGYIETPSPLVECLKDIDCFPLSKEYRGYIHHRYIVWTESDTNTLCFLPKFPIIEHIKFIPEYEQKLNDLATVDIYWNNYYYWDENSPPKYKVYKNDIDFSIINNYSSKLSEAIVESVKHTDKFISTRLN